MGITYADICNIYRQSLKKIEQDEIYLNAEFLRFQHAYLESLAISESDNQEKENTYRLTAGTGETSRVEFIVAEDSTSDSAPAGITAPKYRFDILMHISVDPLRSADSAVFKKRIVLQCRSDAFVYFVDFRQFVVMKKPETDQYKPLCSYLKNVFYNQCRYT